MNFPEKDSIVTMVVDRISKYYPTAPASHLSDVVGQEYDALNSSRLRGFIPNLVQHNARSILHAEMAAAATRHAAA